MAPDTLDDFILVARCALTFSLHDVTRLIGVEDSSARYDVFDSDICEHGM